MSSVLDYAVCRTTFGGTWILKREIDGLTPQFGRIRFYAPLGYLLVVTSNEHIFVIVPAGVAPQVMSCTVMARVTKYSNDELDATLELHSADNVLGLLLKKDSTVDIQLLVNSGSRTITPNKPCCVQKVTLKSVARNKYSMQFLVASEEAAAPSNIDTLGSQCHSNVTTDQTLCCNKNHLIDPKKPANDADSGTPKKSDQMPVDESTSTQDKVSFPSKDIDIVQSQCCCTAEEAIAALHAAHGNIVLAITDLERAAGKNVLIDDNGNIVLAVMDPERPAGKSVLIDDNADVVKASVPDKLVSDQKNLLPARQFLEHFLFAVYERVVRFGHLIKLGLITLDNPDSTKWDIFIRCIAENLEVKKEQDSEAYCTLLIHSDTIDYCNSWCKEHGVTISMLQFATVFAKSVDSHPVAKMFVSTSPGQVLFGSPNPNMTEAFQLLINAYYKMFSLLPAE